MPKVQSKKKYATRKSLADLPPVKVPRYELESGIPIERRNNFDESIPEFQTMKSMKVNQRFVCPEGRKSAVIASKNKLIKMDSKLRFLIGPARDKTKTLIPDHISVWRDADNK